MEGQLCVRPEGLSAARGSRVALIPLANESTQVTGQSGGDERGWTTRSRGGGTDGGG